ncbi:hypothetical protein POM88_045537 [Heracleum sosnowskyi]|uniref:Uncharacterized protein n=1 Tax=Heracleum sosnowskyi TaxID=360622 RepID=A0AAD8H788_9APIA|nr:hypothetical protein POM88_045537 [Heracleum sosnowskyi]
MILIGLLLYSRSMISMLYLGQLGELTLAGGSLAVGFANITGYSILSGFAKGVEPIMWWDKDSKRSRGKIICLMFFTSKSRVPRANMDADVALDPSTLVEMSDGTWVGPIQFTCHVACHTDFV